MRLVIPTCDSNSDNIHCGKCVRVWHLFEVDVAMCTNVMFMLRNVSFQWLIQLSGLFKESMCNFVCTIMCIKSVYEPTNLMTGVTRGITFCPTGCCCGCNCCNGKHCAFDSSYAQFLWSVIFWLCTNHHTMFQACTAYNHSPFVRIYR